MNFFFMSAVAFFSELRTLELYDMRSFLIFLVACIVDTRVDGKAREQSENLLKSRDGHTNA